jgi:hemoglobin-like flavoprotein
MTPEQKTLIRESFAKVLPIADVAGEMLYMRMFELDPSLRRLFHIDIKDQGRKLMTVVRVAVANLDRLDNIVPALEELGERHARYGVKDEDYDTGGEALVWTLEKGLGDDFTPETRQAWIEVYDLLTSVMKDAGHRALVTV